MMYRLMRGQGVAPSLPPQVHAQANTHTFASRHLQLPTVHGLANTCHTSPYACAPFPHSGQHPPTVPGPTVPTLPEVAPSCLGAKGNVMWQPTHHCARDHLPVRLQAAGDHMD